MKKKTVEKTLCAALAASVLLGSLPTVMPAASAASKKDVYKSRFTEMYNKIHNSKNGYFSKLGIPYHSVESLMCEAPDYGHETTSEAYSYYIWLEAMQASQTGDWKGFDKAWDSMETYMIPTEKDQPSGSMAKYNPQSPATYAPEHLAVEDYPSSFQQGKCGSDPISNDLKQTYNSDSMYGMHWLLDVDNWYGFGTRADGKTSPSYINTCQRGRNESCWETVPQPCWDEFKYGGKNGYLDLFTKDSSYAKQFKYTDAPDADGRVVQATYDAALWSGNNGAAIKDKISKSSKMGDYLRYAMFDKYFHKIGQSSQNGSGYDSAHYLMSWYYAWGGAADSNSGWAWKIGCSHNHFGYQNPMTAWVLSKDNTFKPASQNGQKDWNSSLKRQLEMYQWLQSKDGAIAGGCSNSKDGDYGVWPAGTSTFYGMGYEENPVYGDPGSNHWFGWQTWSMQRVAEYYYTTKDPTAKKVLDKWVDWAVSNVRLNKDGTFAIPSNLDWKGQPDTWTGKATDNDNLRCTVTDYSTDLGVASSLANTLIYYSAATGNTKVQNVAKELLDRMYNNYSDEKGITVAETRADYVRFNDKVYIPAGWSGTMPNGDKLDQNSTYLSIRSKYKNDPQWSTVEKALKEGKAPTLKYHRFWAESEFAIANGLYSKMFAQKVSIDPTSASFDKANPTDVNVNVTSGDVSLTGISNGDAALTKGTDYTVSTDGKVVISKNYLAKQKLGSTSLTFGFDNDETKTLDILVKDSSKPIENSTIDPTSATFDLYTKKQADVNVAVDYKGNELKGIYNGETALVKGTDYKLDSDGNVIISKSYLSQFKKGDSVELTFKFSAGKDAVFTVNVTDTTPAPKGSVKVQMYNANTSDQSNTIAPKFNVVNNGKADLDLSNVKIRYYFTSDTTKENKFWCDWCSAGSVSAVFKKMDKPTEDADTYCEISFGSGAGTLAPGKNAEVQVRITKDDWSNYSQKNDYSFSSQGSSYKDWDKVTGYVGTALEWGTEPSGSVTPVTPPTPPTPTEKDSAISPDSVSFDKAAPADAAVSLTLNGNTFKGVYNGSKKLDVKADGTNVTIPASYLSTLPLGQTELTFKFSAGKDAVLTVNAKDSSAPAPTGKFKVEMFNGNTQNAINGICPRFRVTNTGSTPLDMSTVTLHYYFTEDGTEQQQAWCDWSSLGSDNVVRTFKKANGKNADSYLEVSFKQGTPKLAAGESAYVQIRFSKLNWANYDQSNDYSFKASGSDYAVWDKAPAYVNGSLVSGTEPNAAANTSSFALSKVLSTLFSIL